MSPLFILQNKSLLGKPVAVQQHQDIISVSYEARLKGVKKKMTPSQALSVCADLHLGFLLLSPLVWVFSVLFVYH